MLRLGILAGARAPLELAFRARDGRTIECEVSVRRVLGRISADDVAITTRQLAVLVGAGIPLVEALGALIEQIEHEKLKRIVSDVKQRVNEGASLADALAAHPKTFGNLYVNMVRAGESSGALDVVLVRLADFTESQARLRSKVMGTMAYPAFMMVIGTVVVSLPLVGYLAMVLATPLGLLGFLAGAAAILATIWLIEELETVRCAICAATLGAK